METGVPRYTFNVSCGSNKGYNRFLDAMEAIEPLNRLVFTIQAKTFYICNNYTRYSKRVVANEGSPVLEWARENGKRIEPCDY